MGRNGDDGMGNFVAKGRLQWSPSSCQGLLRKFPGEPANQVRMFSINVCTDRTYNFLLFLIPTLRHAYAGRQASGSC
jgi:hypothetical protein